MSGGSDSGDSTPGDRRPIWTWLNEEATANPDVLNSLRALARPLGTTPGEREEAARDLLTMSAEIALQKEQSGEYDPARTSVRSFFLGIARNVAMRRKTERDKHESADTFAVPGDAGDATELWEMWNPGRPGFEIQIQERDWILHILGELSDDDQRAVRLSLLQGLSGQDLADALGVTPGTARTRLSRAMKRLAQRAAQAQERDDVALGAALRRAEAKEIR